MATDIITKLEADAEKLAEKLNAARQKKADADAAEKARRKVAADKWHDQREHRYAKDFGGRIDRAREAFEAAVAEGGDVFGAWVAYRTERRIVAEEWGNINARRENREGAVYDALMSEEKRLNVEMGLLDTTPREGRGPQWKARLAAWNIDLAKFEGIERTPDEGLRLTVLASNLRNPRRMHPGGPDPRLRESFEDAFVEAMTKAEEKAVEAHRVERRAELNAHIAKAQEKKDGAEW